MSLTPEEVLAYLEDGATLHPTDKDYKIYIDTDEGMKKAYFEGWSVLQQQQLIEMINRDEVNFSFPGYFYVLPYFMRFADV